MTEFNLKDPALSEKVGDYLLAQYRRCRERMLARQKVAADYHAVAKRDKWSEVAFTLGADDFPEDDISRESVTFLTSTYSALKSVLSVPPPEVDDCREATAILLSRHTLSLADFYLTKIALFLAIDRRYHPGDDIRIDAADALSAESFKLEPFIKTLAETLVVVNVSLFPAAEHTLLSNELRILELSAAVFFDTLDMAFDLRSVRNCRIAFHNLMQTLGTDESISAVANYVRRHKTMFRDIVALRENDKQQARSSSADAVTLQPNPSFDALEQKIASLQDALETNTRTISNMNRRQQDFLAWLKKLLTGFTALFSPARPAPTPQQVAETLSSAADRYVCLQHVTEPHRSQLKAVIDYTLEHPIAHKGKTRDDFTLSNAARVVWNRHHEAWSKVPGSFDTFNQFKAACYHLQGKDDDPFRYMT